MKNKIKNQISKIKKGAGCLFALCTLVFAFAVLPACHKPSDQSPPIAGKITYHCPMHPQIISDKPGDCPICHMRLVPFTPHPDDSPNEKKESAGMEGQADVHVASNQQQTIGVKLTSVEVKPLVATIRASARVAYDPNLYSAVLEHQQAVAGLRQAPAESSMRQEAERTVRASQLRLRQMGLSDSQIADMGRENFNASNFLVTRTGGPVWVYADIYEYEAPNVRPGQSVQITGPGLSGKVLPGTVRSMDRTLNAETRTFRARIEVAGAGGLLKPEMYVTALIRAESGEALAVPKSAVMTTGTRNLVFVEKAPGEYGPREIILGREADDAYEVLSGLKAGERVVTSANFLIDSESKIKSAIQGAQEHQH